MVVRNYDRPDPKRVIANVQRVLKVGDMRLLQKGSYEFLITHCGFIAYYNHRGFIATYQDDMPSFVAEFLNQHGLGWDPFLENSNSYLYQVSYKGRMLADIVRELIPLFRGFQPIVEADHAYKVRQREETRLRQLAEKLGYNLTPKE